MQLMSARRAQKTKNESRKLSGYSKQWLPGDTLHTFYPIFWDDGVPQLAVGAVWGFPVSNVKELGLKTIFIPSSNEFNEDGQPIGQPDITYQFSLIAKIFVEGKRALEEQAINVKKFPTEAARKEALKDLEYRYDTKNNMNAEQPIIRRANYVISTEVVSVKMANNQPDPQTIAHTSAPLSNDLINTLYQIMETPRFAPQEGDKFLEVEWSYVSDPNKSVSGRKSKPVGLTPDFRIQAQFPDVWQKIESMMTNVSMDAQTIVRRSTKSVDLSKVKAAIAQYCYLHSEYLDAADEQGTEILVRNAQLLKDLEVIGILSNTALADKLNAELAEAAKASIPASNPQLPNMEIPKTEAPMQETPGASYEQTTQDMQATQSTAAPADAGISPDILAAMNSAPANGAPSLQSLMNGQYNMGGAADALDGIDNDFV